MNQRKGSSDRVENLLRLDDAHLAEVLAACLHEAKVRWVQQLFGECRSAGETMSSAVIIPHEVVQSLVQQMHLSYQELPLNQRVRAWRDVREMLSLIQETGRLERNFATAAGPDLAPDGDGALWWPDSPSGIT